MAVMSAELSVTLQRDGTREPFGFRLRGGTDIREAFIIQRVKCSILHFLFLCQSPIFKEKLDSYLVQYNPTQF